MPALSVQAIDPRLTQPMPTGRRIAMVNNTGLRHGTQFHVVMDRLTAGHDIDADVLGRELQLPRDAVEALMHDARRVMGAPDYRRYFDAAAYASASNELSFVTDSGDTLRIDRLVEFANEVCVLDYKTGALASVAPHLLEEYRAQVGAYCVHMALAFPHKEIGGLIIFTGGGSVSVSA